VTFLARLTALTATPSRVVVLALAAFVLRLAAGLCSGAFVPPRDPWQHGYEVGAVAVALAQGRGFSDPFGEPTGPTAAVGPLVPAIWAVAVALFGAHSRGAWTCWVLLDMLASSAAVIATWRLGRRAAGDTVGALAALAWCVHPVVLATSGTWLGTASFMALLVPVVVERFLALASDGSPGERHVTSRAAVDAGAMLGVSLWIEPHLLAFGAGFVVLQALRRKCVVARRSLVALALALALVTPWAARNVLVFGRPVFLRSWLGPELLLGAVAGPGEPTPIGWHPTRSPEEMSRLRQLGEPRYAAEKLGQAVATIRERPGRWILAACWRMSNFWLGRSSWWRGASDHPVLSGAASLRGLAHLVPALLAVAGLILGWRRWRVACLAMAMLFAVWTLTYGLTHVEARYRRPIEPAMLACAGMAIVQAVERRR
jgi:hypothetical protein